MPNNEEGYVVARQDMEIGVDAEQLRFAGNEHARLLFHLPRQRLLDRLAPLYAPAGEVPAGPVGMANEQHAVRRVDHYPLRAERQPARETPIMVEAQGDEVGRRRQAGLPSRGPTF